MKMLHPLTSPDAGIVAKVRGAPGDGAVSDRALIAFENGDPT